MYDRQQNVGSLPNSWVLRFQHPVAYDLLQWQFTHIKQERGMRRNNANGEEECNTGSGNVSRDKEITQQSESGARKNGIEKKSTQMEKTSN